MITQLIKDSENQYVEFKTSSQKGVMPSVVAFANAKNGRILVGVSDSGAILGMEVKRESLQDWINQIKLNTQPSVLVDMQEIAAKGKKIVSADVREYPVKPIVHKNRYYKRIENLNQLVNLNEIANIHLQTISVSWDYYIDEQYDFRVIPYKKKTNEPVKLILELIKKEPYITKQKIMEKTDLSRATITRYIKKLKE